MRLFPVIMSGGSGTRLWPVSRLSRPKQFIPLTGNRSPFQEAVLRAAPLVDKNGRILVIGGALHRRVILKQLSEIGVDAAVLLEPEGRDSAAAMAAATHWTLAQEAEAVNVFLASDHHVPDHAAFRQAVLKATEAAQIGRIVTLGVRPTEPSEAYGYIKPRAAGLSPVEAFIEKPSRELAERYIGQGFLWNSGNFIARSDVLAAELRRFVPEVERAARAALPLVLEDGEMLLGAAFREAPKISIDYAVMERTELASVLAVDFKWSDLGAWGEIAAKCEDEINGHIFEDADGCMVRAPDGMIVAALGVRNLAIVAERDAVLVCDLSRTQEVKKIVERVRLSSPQHMDFPNPPDEDLRSGFVRLCDWLRLRALPFWATVGRTEDGSFCELINLEGRRVAASASLRVQARQARAFALAGGLGWEGPWRTVAMGALERLDETALRAVFWTERTDQEAGNCAAVALSAWAAAAKSGLSTSNLQDRAAALRDDLVPEILAFPAGIRRRLVWLAACLDWLEATGGPAWGDAVRLLTLSVCTSFEEAEMFEAAPCVMLKAACLLARSERLIGGEAMLYMIRRLYFAAASKKDALGLIILDKNQDSLENDSRCAHFSAQIAWLRAATVLADAVELQHKNFFSDEAATALRSVHTFLTPEGFWHDRRLGSGFFVNQFSSSLRFHHLIASCKSLVESSLLDFEFEVTSALR